ncbi:hypothetical protein [Nocardioides massiliensis]|uniref:TetR family transcriptional regulator n=1 Tax=Nocardioides massiliensis TaxID=1325935 RepID=A0ABT9NR42_9ACTN|nr:hypothetical protein [Nocardioides massiliensis]MDP9822781.1 hypothetical protein [Nocardioides massiliensis]
MIRAFREADDAALTDLLLDAQADINASLMGLVLLGQVGIKYAAEQHGDDEEFMLRAVASWVLHVLASKEDRHD